MSEHKFYVNGKRVERSEAYKHWISSDTYKNARASTRHKIWSVALDGDENGNHNPWGEITHLKEAGIELR